MIRISGDLGGILIVIMAGLLSAGVITGILGFFTKRLLADNTAGNRVMNVIMAIIWIAAIALIVLDVLNIFPLIRTLLFTVLAD